MAGIKIRNEEGQPKLELMYGRIELIARLWQVHHLDSVMVGNGIAGASSQFRVSRDVQNATLESFPEFR